MTKRLSNFTDTTLAVGANNSLIPYNPRRKWLYIGGTNATAMTIAFTPTISGSVAGMRVAAGQAGIEFDADKCGDLVTQAVSVWNSGSAGSSFAWAEAWDYADL